ncbi:MAG: putative porin [Burkholderiales bacterium]
MRNIITAGALGLVLTAPGLAIATTSDQERAEIEELKKQVAMVPMLLARIEQLEKANAAAQQQAPPAVAALETRVAAIEESNDHQTDQLAQGLANSNAMSWARNIKWKADFRYRHEQFDVENTTSDRVRHRLRVRLGMDAKISDSLSGGFQIATGESRDARSTNATLDNANTNLEVGLDLAYVDWRPREDMLVTLGKQKYPWFRAGNSLFFDGDVEPEGVAFLYGGKTGVFARAWGYWLEEMASAADSNVFGAQFGYAFDNGLTIAAGYWDYGAIEDQPILNFNGTPAGNSVYTADAACTPSATGLTRCYTYDYNIAEADLQWNTRVGALPLMLFGGYMENMDPDEFNTGYNLGFLLGKASDPHTWEFGAMYMEVEKDAQLGAFFDSDFSDGLTQGSGYVLTGSWAPVKNMAMKATLFLNDRSFDTTSEVDYKRLQVDLNYKF